MKNILNFVEFEDSWIL